METKPDIEYHINRAIKSVKSITPAELPLGFSERVIRKLHTQPGRVRSLYNIPPLLKVAAVFILIFINVFTLRLALSGQQNSPPYVSIKDFANQCQVNDNDTTEELLTTTIPAHEQR